ncbi:MAG: SipW-dependent-type signal peptide-containing protein [Clostridia bacterium]|nr:SipW-dependent-type signal peptide-containing protein [Clostridia bacterium]
MKNNIKKYLTMGLSLVLVAAVSILGTIAYLTDTDSKLNTFTVGNISIALKEDVGVVGEGAEVTETPDGAVYTGAMPGDYLKKEVTVSNDGNNAAYVAVTVTLNNALEINKAIDAVYEAKGYTEDQIQAIYDNVFVGFGMNYKKVDENGNALGMRLTIEGKDMPKNVMKVDAVKTISEYWQQGANNWFKDADTIIPYDGYYTTGMNDYELRYTYYMLLDKNESVTLFKGVNVPEVFNKEQLAMFDGLKIDVKAAAIQADNFYGDAKAAFTALKTELADGVNDGDAGSFAAPVSTADELIEALENGENVELIDDVKIDPANMSNAYGKTGINVKNGQTIDGNGNTIDIKGAGGTWDSGINTTGGTIKNLTVTGSFRGIFVNHNSTHIEPVVLDNVTIKGTVYTISCDQGKNQNLIASNSKFYGWTSYAATLGAATFTNCYFGEGSGYAYMRPYAPTTFVGCDFEAGYEMDARAAVTFEDCTIGGVALTDSNLDTLVTSNIQNAIVK